MAKDPAFLFKYKDYLISTAGWDAEARGWYVNLLCHQADKPEGLPDDMETLAELAGVKISQYNRFVDCYKRTLQAHFVKNDKGLLVNPIQEESLKDRRAYKNKQQKRGIVGAFIKKCRARNEFSKEDYAEVSKLLMDAISDLTDPEKIQECLKHTLEAYATSIKVNANVNGNVNGNKEKGGVGEKEKNSKEDRIAEFGNQVKAEVERMALDLPTDQVEKFISYWTESNPGGRKVKWEMEKTFDISRRLLTWYTKYEEWKVKNKPNNNTGNEREKRNESRRKLTGLATEILAAEDYNRGGAAKG